MRMKYVSKIQAILSSYGKLSTNKVTSCVLDGSYASVFKGKSMNFDELREYVAGDDVKDIDWKATSRSGKVLVRQYIAEKKHNIMLVLDTNRRMLANSRTSDEKRELATMAAGMLALFVNRNNDYVGATYAAGNSLKHFPFKTGLANIEYILEDYNRSVTMDNRTDINAPLEYLIRNLRRRMVIFIVTDLEGLRSISDSNLKRLSVMNDVLLVRVEDAGLDGKGLYDLGADRYLADFFAKDKRLKREVWAERQRLAQECEERLTRYGIAGACVDNIPDMEKELNNMLSKHKFEKR
ncbi:MAG: DUF58 domain-containing protein [Acetatifactor sp.]